MNQEELRFKLRQSPLLRLIAWPAETLRRAILQARYLHSPDSAQVKTLQDRHQGARCFIIGNGPSLRPEDLDRLQNEITFASNRIYHIFPQTAWRPQYYLCMDNPTINSDIERIKSSGSYEKFLNFKAARFGRQPRDHLCYLYFKGKFPVIRYQFPIPALSDDPAHHCTQLATVTANAIELAIYMGFTAIYLLGVDHNYALKREHDGRIHRDPSVKATYFAGMKDGSGKLGDGLSVQDVEIMTASYVAAKAFAEKKGVKIYNATRGGKLEVFERVDFDRLMGGNGHGRPGTAG